MTIILGIDPGSLKTGYGVIKYESKQVQHLASGCIRLTADSFPQRMVQIFTVLSEVIEVYQPDKAAIEQVFMAKNANSALKLGHARGVAMVAIARCGISVDEYAAKVIKKSVTGKGQANKEQVQYMVRLLLQLKTKLQEDQADALAVALCHANHLSYTKTINRAKGL